MKNLIIRRLASGMLGAVLLCAGLSGCGGANSPLDPANPIAIDVWHYYNGPQKQAFDALVEEFNQTVGMEQGIVVEGFNHGSVNELIENVLDAANKKVGAEEVPDIFSAYVDTAWEMDKLGLAAPLDDYLTSEEVAEYRPEYIEEGRLGADGKLKIFPIAKSTELLFLNKTDWDKFSKATGAELSALSTIEGVTDTARRYYDWTDSLTPAPDDGKALFGRDVMANYILIGARQLDVEVFSSQDGQAVLNLDKPILRRLWDNYYVPYINGWFAAYGRFRSDDTKTGDLIAFVGSNTGISYFPSEVTVSETESYPIEAEVLPLPVFEGGEKISVQQGAGMVVAKSTRQREYASVLFLKWFTEEQRNLQFAVASGYLPVKTAANDLKKITAAVESLSEAPKANTLAMFSTASEQLDHYTLYTPRAFEHGNEARNVLENSMSDRAVADREAVLALMQGGLSREDAVARYNTDENFEAWYAELSATLRDAIAQ